EARGRNGGRWLAARPHGLLQFANQPVSDLPLTAALHDSEKQAAVARFVHPEDGLAFFIEERNGAGGIVVKSKVAARDLRARPLLLFGNAAEDRIAVGFVEHDRHAILHLFHELGPKILVEVVFHLVDEYLFHARKAW